MIKTIYIGFYNCQDFGDVYSDSFSFETTIKNNPEDGGLTCQYSMVALEAEMGILLAVFGEPGCESNLYLSFGDVHLNGENNDLSNFGIDLNDWRKIRYEVVDKNVSILVDDDKIYSCSFNRDMGKIIEISYLFYGCGSVKSASLFDKNNKVVFEDLFQEK